MRWEKASDVCPCVRSLTPHPTFLHHTCAPKTQKWNKCCLLRGWIVARRHNWHSPCSESIRQQHRCHCCWLYIYRGNRIFRRMASTVTQTKLKHVCGGISVFAHFSIHGRCCCRWCDWMYTHTHTARRFPSIWQWFAFDAFFFHFNFFLSS